VHPLLFFFGMQLSRSELYWTNHHFCDNKQQQQPHTYTHTYVIQKLAGFVSPNHLKTNTDLRDTKKGRLCITDHLKPNTDLYVCLTLATRAQYKHILLKAVGDKKPAGYFECGLLYNTGPCFESRMSLFLSTTNGHYCGFTQYVTTTTTTITTSTVAIMKSG
jgi:hypothetical protein